MVLGKPDLPAILQDANPHLFTILLAHEPDFADEAVEFSVAVQLSSHSPRLLRGRRVFCRWVSCA